MRCIKSDMNPADEVKQRSFLQGRGVKLFSLMVWGCLAAGRLLRAQSTPPPQNPPKTEAENSSQEVFDPLRAYEDMRVGNFYYNKGNYRAAIGRYLDAAQHRPHFAIPYLKIAKAYKKLHNPQGAIEAYQKYLEILPKGKDAPEARKQIEELQKKLQDKKKG